MTTKLFMLLNLGGTELIIILFVVLLLFGAKKIPELARGMGKGIREFKGALSGINDEIEKAGKVEAEKKTAEPEEEKAKD